MKPFLKIILAVGTLTLGAQAMAQITFYEHDNWRGRTFATSREVPNFSQYGFNDRSSSVIVGSGRWEVCNNAQFSGSCVVLRRGNYASLSAMGLNDRISSVRPINRRSRYENEAPAPLPQPAYEYRRRPNEMIYQANVTSVRAIFGQDQQRCWTERQQVNESRRDTNVGGAVVGALLGGVLGHQVGGGRGRDLATVGGAIAGGTIGARAGNNGNDSYTRDVQRCNTVPDQTPNAWVVGYTYRGRTHHIQMSHAPGDTIAVNRNGEPRQ